ncbi:MAG: 6-carboxytetrahydropterin synthase QueD [Pelotomaculum sp.]|uniref:6-carboxy-5,6,7,8-tetrahydropterin synthase n=1 Tax=Pelotomaculum thermopropionicum (strain DSM 13744 / JCM 10971 / SI) TaxID=370438 RepID=A5D2E2_PELTS|nr:6-carboxytetrahydropterin synthase QueD [Pelotomaculum sp.]BAF59584.1 6-pyruvoyl-tetrahydropterin synthase [Pelotomaculum thermopropionicum SI]
MYEIVVRTSFAAAHSIKGYDGPCSRMHGHTWLVEAVLRGGQLDQKGMLVDFKEVKNILRSAVGELDHQNLNEIKPFAGGSGDSPTAENIARYLFCRIKPEIVKLERNIHLAMVRVWESDTAAASYLEVD